MTRKTSQIGSGTNSQTEAVKPSPSSNHLPKVLLVAPNTRVAHLLPNELRVGWKHNFNGRACWWGSCRDEAALAELIADVRRKYGDISVERRDSDNV